MLCGAKPLPPPPPHFSLQPRLQAFPQSDVFTRESRTSTKKVAMESERKKQRACVRVEQNSRKKKRKKTEETLGPSASLAIGQTTARSAEAHARQYWFDHARPPGPGPASTNNRPAGPRVKTHRGRKEYTRTSGGGKHELRTRDLRMRNCSAYGVGRRSKVFERGCFQIRFGLFTKRTHGNQTGFRGAVKVQFGSSCRCTILSFKTPIWLAFPSPS